MDHEKAFHERKAFSNMNAKEQWIWRKYLIKLCSASIT